MENLLKAIFDNLFLFCIISLLFFLLISLYKEYSKLCSYCTDIEAEATREKKANIDNAANYKQNLVKLNKLTLENVELLNRLKKQQGKFIYEKSLLEAQVETFKLKSKGHKEGRQLKGLKRTRH